MPKIHHECEECSNTYVIITKEECDIRFCPHCGEVVHLEDEGEIWTNHEEED